MGTTSRAWKAMPQIKAHTIKASLGSQKAKKYEAKSLYQKLEEKPVEDYISFGGYGSGKAEGNASLLDIEHIQKLMDTLQSRTVTVTSDTSDYMQSASPASAQDAVDAYKYYSTAPSYSGSTGSSSTTVSTTAGLAPGTWGYPSSSATEKVDLYGRRISGNPADPMNAYSKQNELVSCINLFSMAIEKLTIARLELDSTDLRALEPFEYRERMNAIDQLFLTLTAIMGNVVPETSYTKLRELLTLKGLI